jgi:hypothetical protein
MSGVNHPRTHWTSLENYLVPLPSLPEQCRIAAVLNAIQEAIAAQEDVIAAARAFKRSLMARLFTCGPGRTPAVTKETAIGEIPAHWDIKVCDDVCEQITVGIVVKPRSYYVESGVPAFRSLNIKEDKLEPTDLVFISTKDNDTQLSKSKLRVNDVLIVRTGNPGTSCVVPSEFDGANCIDLVIARTNEIVINKFFSRFFNSQIAKRQVLASKTGLAQQHLNVGAVKRTLVPIPPAAEQAEIVSALETADEKIAAEEDRKAALQAFFQSTLHQLMTGQVRLLNDDVVSAPDAITLDQHNSQLTPKPAHPNHNAGNASRQSTLDLGVAKLTGLASIASALQSSIPEIPIMKAFAGDLFKQAQFVREVSQTFGKQQAVLEQFNASLATALSATDGANQVFSRLLGDVSTKAAAAQLVAVSNSYAASIEPIFAQSRSWQSSMEAMRTVLGLEGNSAYSAVQQYLHDIARISASAEVVLGTVAWEHINPVWTTNVPALQALKVDFTAFSLHYADFLKSLDVSTLTSSLLSPSVTRLPAVELLNGARALAWLTIPTDDTAWEAEFEVVATEVNEPIGDGVEQLLYQIRPQLVDMLLGARSALDSSNPDRIRHYAVSIRELFTHLLHLLAPDQEIRAWSQEREYYDEKNRPTRRARLLYICREVNHPPLAECLSADIKALVQFMDVLQYGTHNEAPVFTGAQLQVLQNRAESGLRFLLAVAHLARS